MSYPEPLYHGETGLINATLQPADRSPDLTYPSGGTVHYLATGESTGGQFGLYRWEMAATQGGPGTHFHRAISESFYILSGTTGYSMALAGSMPVRAISCSSPRAASTPFGTNRVRPQRC